MNFKISLLFLIIASASVDASEKKDAPHATAKHASTSTLNSTQAINTQLATTLAGALISAENMSLGPLAAVPFVQDLETCEKAVIVVEATKAEEKVEKEATTLAHSKFVQREKSLFWSWCCTSDDAL